MQETTATLGLDNAIAAYANGRFQESKSTVLNFGIGAHPAWVRFEVNNPDDIAQRRRLSIEASWLDKVDVYFRAGNKLVAKYNLGDERAYSKRPIENRFFLIEQTFESGINEVYLRVETSDPMLIPIYLRTLEDEVAVAKSQNYSYGFLYGALLVMIAYNAMLYIGLRAKRYIYYALYLSAFILLNMAYTGHGFAWIWPDSVGIQLWSIPFLMLLTGATGLSFAAIFLDTRTNFPRMHQAAFWTVFTFGVLLLATFILSYSALNMALAFLFITVFSGLMLSLGTLAVRSGHNAARYFLAGAVAGVTGALLTDLAVWGVIPFNVFTYRSVEIGMSIDAIFLALALSNQFRDNQKEKIQAEIMARIDSLTGLNNRRAFHDLTRPVWSNALRNQRNISVILLDIDQFKQVNDSYGHAYGDDVLIAVAGVLDRSAREGDVVARWGGEEFILFLPETDLQAAIALAERLRKAIADLGITHQKGNISLTASFGVAQKMPETVSLETLISIADHSLYQAKREGRNRVNYDPVKGSVWQET